MFVVPGNHDTWFTRLRNKWRLRPLRIDDRTEAYERYFRKCPYDDIKQYHNGRFHIIGLNSNKTDKKLENISKGKLNMKELGELNIKMTQIDKRNTFRIALLHHHPWLPEEREEDYFTKLENADEVLNKFTDMQIDMVLFGHKHISFEEYWSHPSKHPHYTKLFLSCAGSATQMGEQPMKNNFKVYIFCKTEIVVINYFHDGTRFIPNSPNPYPYPNSSPFI